MAASHQMVAHDVQRIESIVKACVFPEIVEVTNKRTIVWCPDHHCAKQLALRINAEGYQYEIRRGLKTDSVYLQAWY